MTRSSLVRASRRHPRRAHKARAPKRPFQNAAVRPIRHGVKSRTWENKHVWICDFDEPMFFARERLEMAPQTAIRELAQSLIRRGATTNYRHYYGWEYVQLSIGVTLQKLPTDQGGALIGPTWIHTQVLKRKGLGFQTFLDTVLPSLFAKLERSFWALLVDTVVITHYRRG